MKKINTLIMFSLISTTALAGDGGVIPIPAAVWFFGSALISLGGIRGFLKRRS